MPDPYDLAIIGTGAAGYTASIYASRYKLSNIVIGTLSGGQTSEAHLIQNFPSYKEIRGSELMSKFKEHAESYGAEIIPKTVTSIEGTSGNFVIRTKCGAEYSSKALLLAIGMKHRKLNLPDEERFIGKGLTYCATCDAPLYHDKTVAVVGGSDSANTASLLLAGIASRVFQIYRKDSLRGEPIWAERVRENKKIEVIYNTNVIGLNGTEKLESVTLDRPYNEASTLAVDGLFIQIGSEPDTKLAECLGIELDEQNHIKVKEDQSTSVPGIWAAGDITSGSNNFHQTVVAASEGAIAAESIFKALCTS